MLMVIYRYYGIIPHMEPRPHEKSIEIFTHLARSFRVEVDTLDRDRWRASLIAAKALDSIVDDDHIYSSGWYSEQLLSGTTIPHMTDEEATFVRQAYDTLGGESQKRWRESASSLGSFALRRIQAETVDEYIEVVGDESTAMANVLLVENDERRGDHNERNRLNDWLCIAAQSAYAYDTFTDIVKDHNDGNVSIEITPATIGRLGGYAAKKLVELARATPISVYPAFFRSVAIKVAEKIQQPDTWTKQLAWRQKPRQSQAEN